MSSRAIVQQLDALFQQLGTIFQQQLEAASELDQLLLAEHEALLSREHETIRQITQEKDKKTAELEALNQQQCSLLGAAKQPHTPESLEKVIKAAPSDVSQKIRQIKSNLETVLQRCQDQNIVNGQILAANRQSAEAALAILRGQLSPGNLTYGAGGQPVKEESRSSISKA